ncbi:hypothetical protein NXW38_16720 [Bacteroides ovatus]|nr:hypothetical protein [Bacteroides ovatus]
MKKKIITVALVLSSVCVMAQQKENRDTDRNILRDRMKRMVSGVTGISV